MKYLLPDKYHGYQGKKHGIIDTGKTIEFWCVPPIVTMSDFHFLTRKGICRRFIVGQNKKEGMCVTWPHFVTLEATPSLNKELGVFLYLSNIFLDSMRLIWDNEPDIPGEDVGVKKISLGTVPHNNNIHRLLGRHLHILGRGRIHKVWIRTSPCNVKVIFPYGSYQFDKDGKLTITNTIVTKDRFDHLMLDGEGDA